ncbi:MAG: RNA polymerase sigma factor [Oscillospiraceae bacterium]
MLSAEEKKTVDLIKSNPDEGLALAIRLYGGYIKAICRNILSGFTEQDIEEAVSDCFITLWKSIDRFDESRNSLKAYFHGIARNVAVTHFRKLSKTDELPINDLITKGEINIEGDFDKKESERILHKTVDAMKELERSIFILRYFYMKKVADIAEILEISPKKVENSLYRGKEMLKKSLLKEGYTR